VSGITYRFPNGTVPVLLTSDTPDLLRAEAAAVSSYAASHLEATPDTIAGMLFRTRVARRHRAVAMVTDRSELLGCLQAIVDGAEHPSVIATSTPAVPRRIAYVFPGQGGQRPGMGLLFYQAVPAFKAEAERCAEAFDTQFGTSPLNYLLDEHLPAHDDARTVQPALFTQMAALAALWRSFGITPAVTIGHSQGEIAAAYISGTITLADAVRVVGIRAGAADGLGSGDYAMAVVAADRDTCEDLLACSSGWAQLSVVNSPTMTGISGERETVQGIVDRLTERGAFARIIRVQYPAHTSLINELATKVRVATQRELQNPKFLDTDIACLGATLGRPITQELPVDEYWFWNLRNTVRFDKAIAAARPLGVDTFVELAEHPTLQLAIHENLAALSDHDEERTTVVVGTSERTATDLSEFTRNLAQLALHDLNYPWDCLRTEADGLSPLPLRDFPNTLMNETKLWLPYEEDLPQPARATPSVTPATAARPRLLAEEWVRLPHRSLVSPREIGIIDHTGACADLVSALGAAAGNIGATVRLADPQIPDAAADPDTFVILVPPSAQPDDSAAAAEVATFFGEHAWWPGPGPVSDCWLVTTGGEAVIAEDAPPDLVHAAASAGFRCIGAEHPGMRFRHLDLPAGPAAPCGPETAISILTALHTAEESELALRGGGLYAKRVVEVKGTQPDAGVPEHVLIIGGTGNVGLEFCEHFARRGARRITLVSRSGEITVADRLRQIRSATTTQIAVAQCDVGDHGAVSLLAQRHQDAPADLIIHAAVQYSGSELADLTVDRVDQALRAKVVGIWRVLGAFPRTNNCHVVLCSSIAATVGGRGLIVYAAANRMLDAMAQRLRAEGLDCVSVQWGQWTVTFDPDAAGTAQLAVTGLLPMSAGDALALGLGSLPATAGVVAFDLGRARSVLETCGRDSLVSQLSAPDAMIPETPAPGAEHAIEQRLMKLLAQAIGVDRVETIDADIPLVAIGLDSLQALELRRRIKIEFGHELEVADLLGGASINDVLAQLGT